MKVLIVDDEKELREHIGFEVERLDCDIFYAENGGAALDIFKEQKNIDIVISDVRMPDGDGLELLYNIKKMSEVRIILMSGFADSDEKEALGAGAYSYIHKPFNFREVRQLLKDTIEIIKTEKKN